MQELNFAVMAGCKANELLPKLGLIVDCVIRKKMNLKELKRELKKQDLYDAETFETLLNFLDIETDGSKVKCGEFLKTLKDIIAPEDRQRHLFKHLTAKNEILMKYVIDGLAERLYSTNELYRYITSYVYPGGIPTLGSFKAWMAWLEASGHIKVIGIRWGLSDLGKESRDEIIKLIDVDDILESEAASLRDSGDDDDDDDDYDDDDDDVPAKPAKSAKKKAPVDDDDDDDDDVPAKPAKSAKKAAPVDDDDDDDDDVPAKPAKSAPKKAPVDDDDDDDNDDVPAKPAKSAPKKAPVVQDEVPEAVVSEKSAQTVEILVQPIVPRPDETPLALIREAFASADAEEALDENEEPGSAPAVQIAQFRIDPSTVAANVNAIHTWWRMRPGGKMLTAADYGFVREDFETDALYALFRLSNLALQLFRYGGRLNTSKGGQSFAMLDQMGFYSNLMHSKQTVDKIVLGLVDGGMANRFEDLGNLHYTLIIRRDLKALGAKGVSALLSSPSMADVVLGLWEHIGHFHLTYEILWIARELASLGVLSCEDSSSLGVVPLPKVRETAFRLGFIETPYAADFPHLVSLSRRLSSLFPAEVGWEAPLVYFEPKRDIRYDSSEPAYFTRDQLGID